MANALSQIPDAKRAAATASTWVAARRRGEPIAYLLGDVAFMDIELKVALGCFIPRGDTEALVLHAETLMPDGRDVCVLDACCGVGAIGLAIAHRRPCARVTLLDKGLAPTECALWNAAALGLLDRCHVVRGDALHPPFPPASFDVIVSNAPYLTAAEIERGRPELLFEPREALDGGENGMDFIAAQLASYATWLRSGGSFLFEFSPLRRRLVEEAAAVHGWQASFLPDFSGVERFACLRPRGLRLGAGEASVTRLSKGDLAVKNVEHKVKRN